MDANAMLNRFCELAPLAVMSWIILDEIISDELNVVFQVHRRRGYQRDLLFSQLTRMIAQVVLGLCESPNQAYNKLAQELAVSKAAYYGTLQRIAVMKLVHNLRRTVMVTNSSSHRLPPCRSSAGRLSFLLVQFNQGRPLAIWVKVRREFHSPPRTGRGC